MTITYGSVCSGIEAASVASKLIDSGVIALESEGETLDQYTSRIAS